MSINAGTVQAELTLNTGKYDDNMKRAELQMTKFADKMQTAGQRMDKIGGKMTKRVTLPIVGIGAAALKVAADFESSMSEVAAISGATGDSLGALEAKAREMGSTTRFSASESAQALKYMAMAGWETEQMLDGLEGVMLLAAASGEDLAMVSDIVTDALTAFGMQASQSAELADLLASAASSSNTNVAMLGESFKYVAPLFGALNYSAEDAALALGLMASAGIKSSQSGTVLRAAINRLVAPVGEAGELIERLGINITDANGEMLPFRDLLVQLREKFADLSEEQKAQYASTLFGQQAMAGMLAIIDASEEDFDKLTNATREYNGESKRMADIMEDNVKGRLTRVSSKLAEVGLKLSDTLLPMVERAIAVFERWVDWFDKLDASTKESIVKFGLLAAAIGPALSVIGKMSMGISALTGLLGKYMKAAATAEVVTTATTATVKGLGIAAATAAGKIALITGAVWLFYQAVQDAKKGQDSLGASSGILGYNMQNLQRDIENTKASLSGEKQAREEAIKSVNDYTDSVEAQRLKSQQAVQVQDTARRKYEEQKDIVSQVKDAMNELSDGIAAVTGSQKALGEEVKKTTAGIEEQVKVLHGYVELAEGFALYQHGKLTYQRTGKGSNKTTVYWDEEKQDYVIDGTGKSRKSTIDMKEVDRIAREHNVTVDVAEDMAKRNKELGQKKYHEGGWVGNPWNKRFDEIVALLQSGEFVFSRDMINNAVASLNIPIGIPGDNASSREPQLKRGGDIHQHITIHSPEPLSASEIARKNLQASRQLAMEWGY